jgi:hypothetical protein
VATPCERGLSQNYHPLNPIYESHPDPCRQGQPGLRQAQMLVNNARRYGTIEHRSVAKQIEYWSQIGKIAAENPDLPFSVIRDILIADQEEPAGEYQFG